MAVHFYRRRREYSNSFQCVSLFLFFPALVLFFFVLYSTPESMAIFLSDSFVFKTFPLVLRWTAEFFTGFLNSVTIFFFFFYYYRSCFLECFRIFF